MAGGYREGCGRKKKPESIKLYPKSFCLDRATLAWLNEKHPKKAGQSLVRRLLRDQHEAEQH